MAVDSVSKNDGEYDCDDSDPQIHHCGITCVLDVAAVARASLVLLSNAP